MIALTVSTLRDLQQARNLLDLALGIVLWCWPQTVLVAL
jgi:hypothetical protein